MVHGVLRQYAVLFLLLLTFVTLGWTEGGRYVPIATLVAAVLVGAALWRADVVHSGATTKWQFVMLGLIFVVAYGLRLLPYWGNSLPLGYDYGFYKATFDAYAEGSARPGWMDDQFPPGLPLLHAALSSVGLDARAHLTQLFPLLAALIVFPVFLVVREVAGGWAALFGAALAAVSMTTFTAYEYLYEKNLLAIQMALIMVYFLLRGRLAWAGLMLGAIGIWHRPTLLWAGLALGIWLVVSRPKGWPWLATAAVMLPAWIAMPETFFGKAFDIVSATGTVVASGSSGGTGTFFDRWQYLRFAPYAALALGAIVMRSGILGILGGVGAAWVALTLPFHARFLIMVDAAAVVLAPLALWALVPDVRARAVLASLVLLLAAVPTVQEALDPAQEFRLVNAGEWDDIHWMRDNLPANATIVASNLQAPYVLAESGRETVGPGLFDDPSNKTAWDDAYGDPARLAAFLGQYGDVYVFQGDFAGSLAEPYFTVVYTTQHSTVWHLEAT